MKLARFLPSLPMMLALALPLAAPAVALDAQTQAMIDRSQWKQLRTQTTARLAKQPDDAEMHWLMSRVQQAFGDPKSALVHAEKAVELDGKNADYRLQLAEVCGQSAQKAGPLKGLGLGKRFKREAEAAIELDPKQIPARVDLMMFHMEAPGIVGGDKKKAPLLVDEIARIDPVQGHLARAKLLLEQRDTVRAEQEYVEAARLGSDQYAVRMSTANFLGSRSKWKESEAHARAAQALDPKRPGSYMLLAYLTARDGRWSDLDGTLAAGDAALTENLGPYYQAARALLAEKNDPVRAERYLRKYLTVEPEGGLPGFGGAHWRLGQALEQQNRVPEAIAEMETAVRLKPDLDEAKKDLKRLKRARPEAAG